MNLLEEEQRGISAVVLAVDAADSSLLDLAAVLHGLVATHFEILVVGEPTARLSDRLDSLRATAPGLPLRRVEGKSIADGTDVAVYDLVFVSARDGQFDVRELNHLLDAVEDGADVAVGFRPRWSDGIVRQLQRLGWRTDVDCAYGLFRRSLCVGLRRYVSTEGLLWHIRHLGLRTVELPVINRRPTLGTPAPAEVRAA